MKLIKIKEKKMLNCAICGKPLERKDRKGDGYIYIERLDDKGNTI